MNNYKRYVYVFPLLAMLFWGYSFIWSKNVLEVYNPFTTVFLRLVFSTIILLTYLKITKRFQMPEKKHIGLYLVAGLLNPFLYFVGETFGLKYTSPTISAVMIALIPLLTPVFGYFFIKEKLTPFNIFGIIISFSGVILMLFDNNLNFSASPKGLLFLFTAVISAIVYAIVLKKLVVKYSPANIIVVQNFFGVFYFLPFFLIFEYDSFISAEITVKLVRNMIYLVVFASTMAFVFYTYSVKYLGISRSNVFTNLIPVVTAIASYFLISEEFNINQVIGIAIVVSGVFMSQINRPLALKLKKDKIPVKK